MIKKLLEPKPSQGKEQIDLCINIIAFNRVLVQFFE